MPDLLTVSVKLSFSPGVGFVKVFTLPFRSSRYTLILLIFASGAPLASSEGAVNEISTLFSPFSAGLRLVSLTIPGTATFTTSDTFISSSSRKYLAAALIS